jgi:hypothetical protein
MGHVVKCSASKMPCHLMPIKFASSSGESVLLLLALPRMSGFDAFLLCGFSSHCLATLASFASASTAANFSKTVIGGSFSFLAWSELGIFGV